MTLQFLHRNLRPLQNKYTKELESGLIGYQNRSTTKTRDAKERREREREREIATALPL